MNDRPYLVMAATVLALGLPAATHFALAAWLDYGLEREREVALERRLSLLERNAREIQRYQEFLGEGADFVAGARAAGVVSEAWDRYEVNLQRPVFFDELAGLLAQAGHGPGYYFKPALLDIRRRTDDRTEAQSADAIEGDVTLTLQGSFLVRRR